MSVIVSGMNMPKACMYCPMFNGIGCKAMMKMFDELTNVAVRVQSCPLTTLPEKHGRLIDADDFVHKMEQAMDDTYKKSENLYEKIMSLQIKIIISEVIKGCKVVMESDEK